MENQNKCAFCRKIICNEAWHAIGFIVMLLLFPIGAFLLVCGVFDGNGQQEPPIK